MRNGPYQKIMNTPYSKSTRAFLEEKYTFFNRPSFIESDPIQIPHRFSRREDIEISAFLTSQIAWGRRKMIISNADRMMSLMDNSPYEFIMKAEAKDLKKTEGFVHRTFNGGDLLSSINCLRNIYNNHGGLKKVFETAYTSGGSVYTTLAGFRNVFLSTGHSVHYRKHVSDVTRKSAAKRLNLFLMWMCRKDDRGVHFGLWDIPSSALMIPLDVHCARTARRLGLLVRKQNDWRAVEELTAALRKFDPEDPVKYDFALFGSGVIEKTS